MEEPYQKKNVTTKIWLKNTKETKILIKIKKIHSILLYFFISKLDKPNYCEIKE